MVPFALTFEAVRVGCAQAAWLARRTRANWARADALFPKANCPRVSRRSLGVSRALNFPGSGKSDTHRPVYWLAAQTRHVCLPRNFPSGCGLQKDRVNVTLAAYSCRDSRR